MRVTSTFWRPHSFEYAIARKPFIAIRDQEREKAIQKLAKGVEITRFKGLREISPTEFKHFIGEDMRIHRVEHASQKEANHIFTFYMGKNTPQRRKYIMNHLVVPVED